MRHVILAACLATTVPAVGFAETPITAEEFEAHVTGKTITYHQAGGFFGTEEYLEDRKVRWSIAPDHCQYGTWYPSGEDICFVYEYDPNPACWTFWLRDGALVALSVNGLPGGELYEVEANDDPLPCPGPDVGV
ncbi:hypothetical protein [Tabrizicola sp.]|uniref:hypothetical protein n=1 Tax=Tabrizicola sp. TaxID=2005166 RepID=UPI003F35425B